MARSLFYAANGIAITQTDAVSFFHINMQFQHCIRRDAYHYMAEHTTARTVCLHIDFHSVMQAVQFGFFGRDMDMAPGDNHAVVFHPPPFRTCAPEL